VADSTIGLISTAYSGHCKVCSASTEAHREQDCLLEALGKGLTRRYETLISIYEAARVQPVFRLMNDPADACDVVQKSF